MGEKEGQEARKAPEEREEEKKAEAEKNTGKEENRAGGSVEENQVSTEGEEGEKDNQKEEKVNKMEQLQEQLEYLKKEKEETTEMLQRVKADFDNYRKRTRKEKEEAGVNAVFEFVQKILPVVDNIERALENARKEEVGSSFVEGLEMIKKQLLQVMEQEGITPVEPEGEEFDPSLHEAVMKTEEGEGEPNTVVEVFQKGYTMQGRVLRPAMVRVLVGNEASEADDNDKNSKNENKEEGTGDERPGGEE